MKAILLTTYVLGLASATALAQGTINFGSVTLDHRVLDWDGNPVGSGCSAALYWGAAGSLEGGLIQLGATTGVFAGTGFLAGGTRTTGVATAEGANGSFQVRAWTGGWSTYEAAISSGGAGGTRVGKSAVFSNATGAPNASPPTPPALLTGWTTPVILWIPEPSTAALFGLSLGLVTFFRATRKNRK